jgi:hypothetical protein
MNDFHSPYLDFLYRAEREASVNESKFTPGPWTLETVRTSVGVCHKIGRLGSSTKPNHACLYDDCHSAKPRDLQLLADARLIAVAPDLFAALAGLLEEQKGRTGDEKYWASVRFACNVIGKAEGVHP